MALIILSMRGHGMDAAPGSGYIGSLGTATDAPNPHGHYTGGDALTPQTGLRLSVNGRDHVLDVPRDTALLYVLRNDLALNGPKFGCGLGECGACTVLIDGVAARSCVVPAALAEGRRVVTLEGLGTIADPHPIQAAFIAAQAAQCGFCLNGMIMTAHALLARNPTPAVAEIREELRYNLCRCGAHYEILQAVQRAAGVA